MSILIADSGSTKTAWALLSNRQDPKQYATEGINPYYQPLDTIINTFSSLCDQMGEVPQEIYFYGAGCSNLQQQEKVKEAFVTVLKYLRHLDDIPKITIAHDMLGAAQSICHEEDGIVCILGTGSNACQYQYPNMTIQSKNYGFWLGDEGSGGHIGKTLVMAVMHREAPSHLITSFEEVYQLSHNQLIDVAYQKPFPNRFFAQFSTFAKQYIQDPYVHNLVLSSITQFLERYVLPLDTRLKINFVGSVAYHYTDILQEALNRFDLTLGKILKDPIDGLITFYQNQLNQNNG